ncbi:MAG: T9SS type A sorting domain-containing protein [Ferruginibacter sp.]
MKKKYLFILLLICSYYVNAQTWTGGSTNWNNPANWNPMTVPTSNDIATIPGGLGNYPVLQNNITVRSINMQAGSKLDVNGFSLTIISNDFVYFTGATLINSDATKDIILNINTGDLGFTTYFKNNTVNDNIVFNLSGGNTFLEGDAGVANQFNGNVTYNITDRLPVKISDAVPSQFNGNLTVNRTSKGETHVCNGGGNITGNYLFIDNTGSITLMGNNTAKTNIAGTVNITVNDPSVSTATSIFEMHRIINQTNGGNILIQNTAGFLIERDTLKNVAINITGTRGNIIGDILNSSITANTLVSNNVTSLGNSRIYVRDNLFTGNSNFITNGNLIDLYEWGNHFIGNTTFTVNSGTSLHVCYTASSIFDGNVTINRTVAGYTEAFVYGAIINGNFIYTNNTAGDTHLGNFYGFPGRKTTISGTINITAHFATAGVFALDEVMNQAGGGNIDVLNSKGADIKNDTLIVNAFSITGYSNGFAEFFNNQVTGNVTLADAASNSGSFVTDLRNNIVTGTSSFTSNGSSAFFDAYNPQFGDFSNTYFGDVTYTRNNGDIYIGVGGVASNMVSYCQNLTLNSASNITIGKIKFICSGNSIIEQLGTQPIIADEITIEKTGTGKVTLNDPVTISAKVTFISGIIYSSIINSLTFGISAIQTGASPTSYLDGPVTKIGNTAFTFPVGKPGEFALISISAPANVTDAFRAQYFSGNPAGGGYNTALKDASLDHLSSSEYWILDRTVGTSPVFVTLTWDAARSGPINNLSDLRVARWNGSLWKDEGNSMVTGTNAAGSITSLGAVTNFSPFTLGSATAANVLPVKLVSFTGNKCNSNICLSWITENEQNLSHYEIEKSNDGIIFSSFINVNAINTTAKNTYNAKDVSPFGGISFYRLKIIDKDGRFKYSSVIKVNIDDTHLVSLLPNPAHNFIFLKGIKAFSAVKIISLTGKIMLQQNITSDLREINISNLPADIYLVQLLGKEKTVTLKLIKY